MLENHRMLVSKEQLAFVDENDSVDSYFECITSCSLGEEGNACVARCVEVHLKSNLD